MTIAGQRFRSKWAWAYDTIAKYGSVSEWYRAVGKGSCPTRRNVVALKEEAGKTRLIISTPLDSYLRQAWLLSCFGAPLISATFAGFDIVLAKMTPDTDEENEPSGEMTALSFDEENDKLINGRNRSFRL